MENNKKISRTIAFCGLISALGTVFMLSGGLIPVATYCAPLIAASLLLPIIDIFGCNKAVMVWLVTAFLSLLLSSDKESAFFYIFFGYYPIIKQYLNKISQKILKIFSKLFFFSLSTAVMYLLLYFVLCLDTVISDFSQSSFWINMLFCLLLVFALMLYDKVLDRLNILYFKKLKPKFRFLR